MLVMSGGLWLIKRRRRYVQESRSRIHEPIILLRFLGKILRVLRLEVTVYNVYATNQFQTTFARGGRGEVKSFSRDDCE
jgi:hypothetical protein